MGISNTSKLSLLAFSQVVFAPSGFSQTYLFEYSGPSLSSQFGRVVHASKTAALLVSSNEPVGPSTNAGVVRAYSAHSDSPLATFLGLQTNAEFGSAMGDVNDLNGNFIDEWIFGAPGQNGGNGSITVLDSRFHNILITVNGSLGERFGHAVHGIQDVNIDGFADIVVGAPARMVGSATPGRVYVVSGQTGQVIRITSGSANEQLGMTLAVLSDVNGDSVVDFAVGAPGFVWNGYLGAIKVVSGATGAVLFTILPDAGMPSGLGSTLQPISDINSDGITDIIAGSQVAKRVRIYSGFNGQVLQDVHNPDPNYNFAVSIAYCGRLDADLLDDFAVGAPGAGNTPGKVFFFSSATGQLLTTAAHDTSPSFGTAISNSLGFSFVPAFNTAIAVPAHSNNTGLVKVLHPTPLVAFGHRCGPGHNTNLFAPYPSVSSLLWNFNVTNAPANAVGVLYFSLTPANPNSVFQNCRVYLDFNTLIGPVGFQTNASGQATLSFPGGLFQVALGYPVAVQVLLIQQGNLMGSGGTYMRIQA